MNHQTAMTVREILRAFALEQMPKLTKWSLSEIGKAYPFHRLFFPDEAILAARVERSVVTAMGNNLYPKLAKAVALGRFSQVETEYLIRGHVNDAACNMIDQIVTELRARSQRGVEKRRPDLAAELEDILSSRGGGPREINVTADLYIGDFTGGPLFVELKTPLPNLDMAAESKRKMLSYLAIMDRQNIDGARAFLGLTYNPFLTRERYSHSYTRQIMDMTNEVLIGQELWDYIGGPGTYDELLTSMDDVRRSIQLP